MATLQIDQLPLNHPVPLPPSGVSQKRKRGGQPGNRNAHKHGLYSAHAPHKHIKLLRPAPLPLQVVRNLDRNTSELYIEFRRAQININRKTLLLITELMERIDPQSKEYLILSQASLRVISMINNLFLEIHRIEKDRDFLPELARDASWLVDWEFSEKDIHKQPVFVPQSLGNFHTNLALENPILTNSQWQLIEGALRSLQQELDLSRKYKRHKQRFSPRYLMQGILLKLATGEKWSAIPALFRIFHPEESEYPLRTAQKFYRQLYSSGLMMGIYERFHEHLCTDGDTTLEELVAQETFVIADDRVTMKNWKGLTWQKFTALLLLQRAAFNRRTLNRKQDARRRQEGRYIRLPAA